MTLTLINWLVVVVIVVVVVVVIVVVVVVVIVVGVVVLCLLVNLNRFHKINAKQMFIMVSYNTT